MILNKEYISDTVMETETAPRETHKPQVESNISRERKNVRVPSLEVIGDKVTYDQKLVTLSEDIDFQKNLSGVTQHSPNVRGMNYAKLEQIRNDKFLKIQVTRNGILQDTLYFHGEQITDEEARKAVVLTTFTRNTAEKMFGRKFEEPISSIVASENLISRPSRGKEMTFLNFSNIIVESDNGDLPENYWVLAHEYLHSMMGVSYLDFMTEGIAVYYDNFLSSDPQDYSHIIRNNYWTQDLWRMREEVDFRVTRFGVSAILNSAGKSGDQIRQSQKYEYNYPYGYWIVDEIIRNNSMGLEFFNKFWDKVSDKSGNTEFAKIVNRKPPGWENQVFSAALMETCKELYDGDPDEEHYLEVRNSLMNRVNEELKSRRN